MAGAMEDMMNKLLIVASLASVAAAMPATAQGRLDWRAGDYRLVGNGVPLLDAELRTTARGRAFVMRNFDFNADGRIAVREADAANAAFVREAGPRRDRFDWASRGVIVEERSTWNQQAMRGYGFRQTPRGATMNLTEEVLFRTGSADLRPGAVDKLEALADYLRAEPRVRIAIDGHTDAVGSDAANLTLSQRRAASVRAALDEMGVTRARFLVAGHGEAQPVASNATAAGRRQNRRVEVTLLGQRADRFRG